jgi:hypothetical protein
MYSSVPAPGRRTQASPTLKHEIGQSAQPFDRARVTGQRGDRQQIFAQSVFDSITHGLSPPSSPQSEPTEFHKAWMKAMVDWTGSTASGKTMEDKTARLGAAYQAERPEDVVRVYDAWAESYDRTCR